MKLKDRFEVWIASIYLVFGILWILLTDILIRFLISNPAKWTSIQSFKGIFFVLLSTSIIYLIARHYNNKQLLIKKHLRKAKEKAEENERLKSAFLINMSHEIRTPMNGIMGFINLLEQDDIENEKHPLYLEYMRKSSERMLETINDIITIAQIDTKQSEVKNTTVHLIELMNHMYHRFLPSADKKGLKFILTNKLQNGSSKILTDNNKLESILSKLINNAIKFSHSGEIELCCSLQKDTVLFYVRDTGIGIPSAIQKDIFSRFVQADNTITRPYEGTGLGLAIAKAYAELLNGNIWLESEEGKGSTFWLSIPYVSAEPYYA